LVNWRLSYTFVLLLISKMKKTILSAGLSVFAIILLFSVYQIMIKKTVAHSFKTSEGEDAEDFIKWDQKRLADPATGKIPDNIRVNELAFAATLPNDLSLGYDRALTAGSWSMRGPWNVGGRTRSFAADVKNESILLAGTCAGGMWRSTDTGKSWTLTTPLAIEQSVSCLAQDTRAKHSNVWYYGSGECYGTSASAAGAFYLGNGLYRSLDDGQTWKVLPATNFNTVSFKSFWQALWNVATDPSAPDSESVVYACSIGAVYRSADTGNTWKTVLGGNASAYSYYTDVQVSKTGVVYAALSSDGPQKGIWRSTDGINFTNITPKGFPASYNRVVIGISPTDPNQVYFLANTNGAGMPDTNFLGQVEWDGLWKYKYISGSGDSAGGAWWDLTANLPHTGGVFDKYNSQTSYDMVVRFFPNDTAMVFIGGTDIFRSTTGFFDANHTAHIGGYGIGAAWPAIQVYPGHHPDQHMVFFSNNNPYVMYSSCDGGVFKTYNDTAANVKWTSLDNGYVTTMFYTAATAHDISGSNLLVGGAQDNDCLFTNSSLVTNLWTKPIFGDGAFVAIEDSAKVFYYSSQDGKIFKAQMDTIAGTVSAFTRIDPIGGKGYQFVNPYAIDPNNTNIMYNAGGKYLWRNDNLAGIPYLGKYDSITTNWVQFTDSVPLAGNTISAIGVSTIPANRVYYGTANQRLYRVDNANIGTPTPKDITSAKFPFFPTGAYVSCVAVDPANADNVIVAFSNYSTYNLFYTKDGGASWGKIAGNLYGANSPSIRWAAFQHLPTGGTIYWVATSTGLYATDLLKPDTTIKMKDSTVWVQQATNTIGNSVCNMIDIRPSDGLVVVATHTHGAYAANITNVNQVATVNNLTAPVGMQLSVYPNPSHGQVSVSFWLKEEANVDMQVFDVQGRMVKAISNNKMAVGEHIIPFNTGDLSSGIYYCTLHAGNTSETKRLIVVK
jgi:hypothetical protein